MTRPHRPRDGGATGRPSRWSAAHDLAAPTDGAAETLLDGDRGAVTVEAALALFSLVAVMALAVAAVAGASAHLRCLDAAREAARLVARGETDRARDAAAEIAPRGATIAIAVAGDQVQVDVSTTMVPGLPGLSLDSRAVGVLEPAALLTSGGPADPVPGSADPGVADDEGGHPRANEGDGPGEGVGAVDGPVAGADRPPADTAAPGAIG